MSANTKRSAPFRVWIEIENGPNDRANAERVCKSLADTLEGLGFSSVVYDPDTLSTTPPGYWGPDCAISALGAVA